MLDFARFQSALGVDGGLEREGIRLAAETLTGLRGHEAYALAWFENWSRDGQPADGRIAIDGPYQPSPDVDVSDFAVAGYARTGDEPAAPALDRPSTRRAARAAAEGSGGDQVVVMTAVPDQPQASTPRAPAPGWYPSPSRASHEQWWDGRAWTAEHRSVPAHPRGLARLLRRRRTSEERISR
ncbi:uncharacterized protein DUF2510 [Labedella gwakjiensis]|uniref:DUF2510 domain-containing protein n=1 Tax=Labedella gwakjiensis TaxID=390269 RepID=A0A2P8GVC4_9MICO|nr:DUF2510 domain-containing protein [Labedella gwakjiensis]PSL37922.1 uncharacterized protein DUF2510 [Labedella gwakjiensis]RUQ87511.1 DUF2510 domain-containing protein [Labedella gwakjiensis]